VIQRNAIAETSTTAPLKLLVTVVEAAEALGIGRTAMYDLLLAGELPSVKIGRARRIPVQALETFVARRLADASTL
jgi:excisionase family DNA binding protein